MAVDSTKMEWQHVEHAGPGSVRAKMLFKDERSLSLPLTLPRQEAKFPRPPSSSLYPWPPLCLSCDCCASAPRQV